MRKQTMTTWVNMKPVVVIREPWRADPLAWIHRGEARAIARELGAPLPPAPFVLKPRRESDSIGVRIARRVPHSMRDRQHLVQQRIIGCEVTIAVFHDRVGAPLEICLPHGKPYSFLRKYLARPHRAPLVGPGSAFAESFCAAGIERPRQLEWLVAG
jgi:hypothetical protein